VTRPKALVERRNVGTEGGAAEVFVTFGVLQQCARLGGEDATPRYTELDREDRAHPHASWRPARRVGGLVSGASDAIVVHTSPGGLPQGAQIPAVVQIPEVIRYATSRLLLGQAIGGGIGAMAGLMVSFSLRRRPSTPDTVSLPTSR
jgi:hypothetical protein